MKTAPHNLIDMVPALLSLATAVLDALLNASGTFHSSNTTTAIYITLALVVGRAISGWLHAQAGVPVVAPVAPASGVAVPSLPVVDPGLLVSLIESTLRASLESPVKADPVVVVSPSLTQGPG